MTSAQRLMYGPNPLQEELAEFYNNNIVMLPNYMIDIRNYTATELTLHEIEVDC